MAAGVGSRITVVTVVIVYLSTVRGYHLIPEKRAAPPVACSDNAPICGEDTVPNLCTDPIYADFVFTFCRETCRLCRVTQPATTTTPIHPSCKDTINNCDEYQSDTCTNPEFAKWAKEHCRRFCNLCQSQAVVTTPMTTTTETPHPDGLVCFDRIDCRHYDVRESCCGPYEPWARRHCAKHCKFCEPDVPETRLCHDTDEKCSDYNSDLCTNPSYKRFVEEHCAGTCKVCEKPVFTPSCATANPGTMATTTTKSPTVAVLTTSSPGACENLIDCSGYDIKTACCGEYESWARKHCSKFCKFCTPDVPETPLCDDTLNNCDEYGSDLCTNPEYDRFVHENCAGTCDVCSRPVYVPSCANTTSPSSGAISHSAVTSECFMYTKHAQGNSWETPDCLQHCTCVSGATNTIYCKKLECPKAVPECELVHIPGHCCPILHNCKPKK